VLEYEVREIRMLFWNRILQGAPPQAHEVDEALLAFTREADSEARLAFTLLRACAEIAKSGTETMQRYLKVALLCWFSAVAIAGERSSYHKAISRKPHVHEIVNRRITWHEAASIVGVNPDDYTARQRLMKRLQAECAIHWVRVFGNETRNPFEVVIDHV